MDVNVDRDEQARRIDAYPLVLPPEPQVDAVGTAHHPAQEEQQALAPARSARIGQEMSGTATRGAFVTRLTRLTQQPARGADGVAPRGKGVPQGAVPSHLGREEGSEGPMLALQDPGAGEQPRDVVSLEDAVLPPAQGCA
jgi:hypothetical protein